MSKFHFTKCTKFSSNLNKIPAKIKVLLFKNFNSNKMKNNNNKNNY